MHTGVHVCGSTGSGGRGAAHFRPTPGVPALEKGLLSTRPSPPPPKKPNCGTAAASARLAQAESAHPPMAALRGGGGGTPSGGSRGGGAAQGGAAAAGANKTHHFREIPPNASFGVWVAVSNVPRSSAPGALKNFFKKASQVLWMDASHHEARGTMYMQYADYASAQRTCQMMDRVLFDGAHLSVSIQPHPLQHAAQPPPSALFAPSGAPASGVGTPGAGGVPAFAAGGPLQHQQFSAAVAALPFISQMGVGGGPGFPGFAGGAFAYPGFAAGGVPFDGSPQAAAAAAYAAAFARRADSPDGGPGASIHAPQMYAPQFYPAGNGHGGAGAGAGAGGGGGVGGGGGGAAGLVPSGAAGCGGGGPPPGGAASLAAGSRGSVAGFSSSGGGGKGFDGDSGGSRRRLRSSLDGAGVTLELDRMQPGAESPRRGRRRRSSSGERDRRGASRSRSRSRHRSGERGGGPGGGPGGESSITRYKEMNDAGAGAGEEEAVGSGGAAATGSTAAESAATAAAADVGPEEEGEMRSGGPPSPVAGGPGDECRVLVCGIPRGTDVDALEVAFEEHVGRVLAVDLLTPLPSRRSQDCVVTFQHMASGAKAVDRFDGGLLNGSTIAVRLLDCEPAPPPATREAAPEG